MPGSATAVPIGARSRESAQLSGHARRRARVRQATLRLKGLQTGRQAEPHTRTAMIRGHATRAHHSRDTGTRRAGIRRRPRADQVAGRPARHRRRRRRAGDVLLRGRDAPGLRARARGGIRQAPRPAAGAGEGQALQRPHPGAPERRRRPGRRDLRHRGPAEAGRLHGGGDADPQRGGDARVPAGREVAGRARSRSRSGRSAVRSPRKRRPPPEWRHSRSSTPRTR